MCVFYRICLWLQLIGGGGVVLLVWRREEGGVVGRCTRYLMTRYQSMRGLSVIASRGFVIRHWLFVNYINYNYYFVIIVE